MAASSKSFHIHSPSTSSNLRPTSKSANNSKMHGDKFPYHLARPNPEEFIPPSPQEAVEYALTHLLAIKDFTLSQCAFKLKLAPEKIGPILLQIADKHPVTESYLMLKKWYKKITPWEFPYGCSSDREKAINNAIHAFDAMRIDPADAIWQILLPEDQRNQGKTLSKLKIQPAKSLTPGMKPKVFNTKTGLPKRPESQKKAEPTKSTKESTSSQKRTIHAPRNKPANGVPQGSPNPSTDKPSTSAKSLLNKPRNPSPLAASPPVNASDFDDRQPLHRSLSASPTKNLLCGFKRKPELLPTVQRPVVKQPRVESSSTSTPKRKDDVASTKPTHKRKFDGELDHDGQTPRKVARDSNSVSVKSSSASRSNTSSKATPTPPSTTSRKKQSITYNAPYARSNMSDSSSSDGQLTLSLQQQLKLAAKFKKYYADYQKSYLNYLNALRSEESPSQAEYELVVKKHEKVAEMKEQLRSGIVRQ
jgi:RNA polymerase II elongation factor ELL